MTDQCWPRPWLYRYQIAVAFGAKDACIRDPAWVPRPAQPSCVIHPIALCVHVLLSAGRRSSHQGATRNRQCAISLFSTCRYVCPSCLFTSHPNHFPSPIPKQGPRPPPTPSPLLVGCFSASFDTGRLDSSRHPACLAHPSAASAGHQTKGPIHSRARYLGHGPAVIVASLIRATYSTRKRFIPTSARYYYAHLHFFRLTRTHFASMICIGSLD